MSSDEDNSDVTSEGESSDEAIDKPKTSTRPVKKNRRRNIDEEYAQLKEELTEMSFEMREKLKQKVGLKVYNKIMKAGTVQESTTPKEKAFKRENKNRPQEVSSKKKPPKIRNVIDVKKTTHRDPRFDDLCGTYDETLFKRSYGFITDIKQKEKTKLLKKLQKEKDEDRKEQIQHLVKKIDTEEEREKKKEHKAERLQQIKRKEKELIKEGKTPFYLKQSEKKKLELAEKFAELKKSGKMEKYLERKRKKNAMKERRKLPAK